MLAHERLDVYRVSIELVAYTLKVIDETPRGHSDFVSQLKRAISSIPFNIAEGAGKTGQNDKKRFYGIARGSATESAAIYDVLYVADLITEEQLNIAKGLLGRIIAMLTKLCLK